MEEPAFLMPVQRVVGGIEIKDDLLRCLVLRFQKDIDKQPPDGSAVMADPMVAGRFRCAQLQPVQRALPCQRGAAAPPCFELADQRRQHRVAPQLVMVEQVLIPERDPYDTLCHHGRHAVLDQLRHPLVRKAGGKVYSQPDRTIGLAQQQRPGIRSDRTTVERCHHGTALDRCKIEQLWGTLYVHRGIPPFGVKPLLQKNFRRFGAPTHLFNVRNAG
jgi:hypothetical protein